MAALAVASMGESGVLVDADGIPLAPVLNWYDRRTVPWNDWWRQRLDELFQRHQSSNGREKLIYAGFGSAFSTNVDFLRNLAGTTSDRPDWNLVISLSNRTDPTILGPLPERLEALQAPHDPVEEMSTSRVGPLVARLGRGRDVDQQRVCAEAAELLW